MKDQGFVLYLYQFVDFLTLIHINRDVVLERTDTSHCKQRDNTKMDKREKKSLRKCK